MKSVYAQNIQNKWSSFKVSKAVKARRERIFNLQDMRNKE